MTTPLRPTLLIACALALCATSAQAQDSLYRIFVSNERGQCSYEIAGADDQDEFVIAPGGIVVLDPVGAVVARATVLSDDASGLGGTEGNDVYSVSRGESRAIDIRPALGRETVHGLKIECCAQGTSVRACQQWTRARPKTTLDPSRSITAGTDSTRSVDTVTTQIMGPRMKVGN